MTLVSQWIGTLSVALSIAVLACTPKQQPAVLDQDPATQALAKRGRIVYKTQCIACHHPDPKKAGALGPEVFGSNRELLESRILRAGYPKGYQPKRNTHTMVALPHLKGDIEAIYTFLNP